MKNKNLKTFDEHLDKRYGKTGIEKRIKFEIKAKSFVIGELIKEFQKGEKSGLIENFDREIFLQNIHEKSNS